MQPGLIFALVWAVLALVVGAALVMRRSWLADTIAAERRSRAGTADAKGPSRTLFLIIGLLFVGMGLFIVGWWIANTV